MSGNQQSGASGARLEAVRDRFDEWGVEGILVASATNRRWLSGFTGSAGMLLVTRERALLGTDFRYWEQAADQAPAFELVRIKGSPQDGISQLLADPGAAVLGLESDHLRVSTYDQLLSVDGIQWVKLEGAVDQLRQVKTPCEVEAIRAAAAITDRIMARVNELARIGMTERELAWELEKGMREAGATGMAFPIIVAFGPNAARSHHRAGNTVLTPGVPVIVDMGAELDGYNSDLTRTFFAGRQPDDRFQRIYDLVYEAHASALAGLRPGLTGKVVDALARDVISAAGHGEAFGHSLGHGVGLDIHEQPRLSALATDQPLPAGSVVTVEPGVYLPEWGGVRIEDLVLITEDGPELLSHCPKEPILPL